MECAAAKNYDQAIKLYQHALEIHPQCIDAYVAYGAALANKGDNNNLAIEQFENALKLDAKHPNAWTYLEKLLDKMGDGSYRYRRSSVFYKEMVKALRNSSVHHHNHNHGQNNLRHSDLSRTPTHNTMYEKRRRSRSRAVHDRRKSVRADGSRENRPSGRQFERSRSHERRESSSRPVSPNSGNSGKIEQLSKLYDCWRPGQETRSRVARVNDKTDTRRSESRASTVSPNSRIHDPSSQKMVDTWIPSKPTSDLRHTVNSWRPSSRPDNETNHRYMPTRKSVGERLGSAGMRDDHAADFEA